MWQEKVYFENCRGEKISGILSYPEEESHLQVLILGPHPLLGGDMENNVIQAIAKNIEDIAIVLRFDYHGCGESEAHLDGSLHIYDYYENLQEKQEVQPFFEDIRAAKNYLSSVAEQHLEKIIVGYSFGAYLALLDTEKSDKILIAPPFSQYSTLPSIDFDTTSCLIAGNDFIPQQIPDDLQCTTWSDADHFFRGKENDVGLWIRQVITRKEIDQ